MKPEAIVYTSNTGFTRRYAQLLADKTGLPAVSLDDSQAKKLSGKGIIYLGWISASHIKGYSAASRKYKICAVCGVGLCETGTMVEETRKATSVPENVPLFTLQGGFAAGQLKGINKMIIGALKKGLTDKKDRTPEEERMLQLVSGDSDFVCEANLESVLEWLKSC